ncbi:MAG: L-serine ammonia-lyase, iron-sulfur-dependent, subunit alpha [Synergistaceae bacterium]|jgi:L-serine dehydratase|nr:L-serine ammonia-lyase, iron-sulfur-dependent, subunit alpha [Synergistaceae bacterium]
MKKLPPSIFNDIIGPVMRGPSSSHVAGASRIADLVRQSLDGDVAKVVVDFDVNGSLAESHDGHGTDMGFAGGILGIDMTDPLSLYSEKIARERGVEIEFRVLDYGASHPNNYRVIARDSRGRSRSWEGVSVGGGMIEMRKYDGFDVSIAGDFYELLFTADTKRQSADSVRRQILELFPNADSVRITESGQSGQKMLIELKYSQAPNLSPKDILSRLECVVDVAYLEPILPTRSSASVEVPFKTAAELLEYADGRDLKPWEYAVIYESRRGGVSNDEVFQKMRGLVSIMEKSVDEGLRGTAYEDRILGAQARKISQGADEGRLVPGDVLNSVVQCITSIMEVKSSMGVIVAAPTAGSCGCLPGTLVGLGRSLGMSKEEITKGMLMAGLIGIFIAESATFAAEVGGCQVECGSGSSMAAAGVVQMMGGDLAESLDAASMALQNMTGLACDPVANRVEVPCLGKNVMGGSNAIVCANMALAGYDKVIPLDQTIEAIYDIGISLPLELRCTLGGLGKTKTSAAIRERLKARR